LPSALRAHPAVIHTKQFVRNHPAVMLISNIREDGKPIGALPDGEMHFHTDQCHQERARHGVPLLYAIEVPSVWRQHAVCQRLQGLRNACRLRSNGVSTAAKRSTPTIYGSAARQSGARRLGDGGTVLCPSGGAHASRNRGARRSMSTA